MDAVIEQCPAYGIRRINGEFYWSTGVVTTPDKVYRKNAVKLCLLGQGCKAHTVLSSQTCDKIAV